MDKVLIDRLIDQPQYMIWGNHVVYAEHQPVLQASDFKNQMPVVLCARGRRNMPHTRVGEDKSPTRFAIQVKKSHQAPFQSPDDFFTSFYD